MTLFYVRLSLVSIEEPISDPTDRGVMPMSTLIASPRWLLEAAWDGVALGDVQVYKNDGCTDSGVQRLDAEGKPVPDSWLWWGGVPHGRIKSYKFADAVNLRPQTVAELPFKNAERKAKSREAGETGTQTA